MVQEKRSQCPVTTDKLKIRHFVNSYSSSINGGFYKTDMLLTSLSISFALQYDCKDPGKSRK